MFDYLDLPYANAPPASSGTIKTSPDDFKVHEILGFELTDEGEHLFLYIEKRGLNTEELVKSLARQLGKSEKLFSYAGLKDRQAVTRQWICMHCPNEDIDGIQTLEGHGWRVLESRRHLKKLKKGALKANAFELVIRDIEGIEAVESRLQQIQASGVPNYFGPQRFGFNGQNIERAHRMLTAGYKVKDRFLRGIYYSTARAFLFNKILSERVRQGSWNHAIAGDVMQLSGSHSIFSIEKPDDLILSRVKDLDISPAAVLWGRGEEKVSLDSLALQQAILDPYQPWCAGLESQGLERAYRAQRLLVQNLSWFWQERVLTLHFELTAGSFATAVVRELMVLN